MRRSKEQIIEEILNICKEPAGLTKIVYLCNLNFKVARLHLNRLNDAGLLDVSGTNQILYRTTPKGMQALEYINAFRPLLMPVTDSKEKACVPEGL